MVFLKSRAVYLTLGMAIIILFFSLLPLEGEKKILISDKFFHFVAYGLLILPVSLERVNSRLLIFLFAMSYGGFIELIQPFWGREADIVDFWSNIGGIIFGILIAQGIIFVLRFIRKKSERN